MIMSNDALTLGLILMGCLLALGEANAAKVERLAQPCRAKLVLTSLVTRDPETGREHFVLTNPNESSGMEFIFLDVDTNTGTVVRAPAGDGSWALNEIPGRKLVTGTYYDGKFMVLDLNRKRFTKTIDFPGEEYIWNLAMGKDGRLYGGTYPGGKLGALDLETFKVEDCGAPAPPNQYLRYVSATPDGRIFCHFMTAAPVNKVYDPETRRFSDVPKELAGVQQGAIWNGYFVAGKQAFEGPELKAVQPRPFPAPPGEENWTINVRLSNANTLFIQQGNRLYRFKKGDSSLELVSGISLNGGAFHASREDGTLLGIRGQDYFVFRPGDTSLDLRPIPVSSSPRPTHFLRMAPNGILWGGPSFGQTLYSLDTRTRKFVNTSQVSNHGGEVYDVAFLDNVLYAASYAGGEIIRYNPSEPWDQWNHKNPRTIAVAGPNYIRPAAGIKAGPDGRLYSGWWVKYGAYGGALSITDPKTEKTEILENPLGALALSGVDVDDRYIYMGTTLAANGLPLQTGVDVCLGVMDGTNRQIVKKIPFPKASSVFSFTLDQKAERLVFRVDKQLRILNTRTLTLLPVQEEWISESRTMATPGDGYVYFSQGKNLLRGSLDGGPIQRLATVKDGIEDIVVGDKGLVYVSGGTSVYRITLEDKDLKK